MEGEIVTSVQSSKTKTFPKGVRILVVDDDSTCLAIIAAMLRTCKYEVVAVNQAIDALSKLREKEGRFDLILTDVHMPDMDGFELLKHVEEELKLPVIMMSSDDKENIMLRGLESGAVFYLVKPVTLEDLKTLWQYAVVMKKDVTTEIEQIGSAGGSTSPGKVYEEDMECASSVNEGNCRQKKSKRKTNKEMDADEEENKDDSNTEKKARVVWTNELHNQFLKAMDQLGLDNAVPKKLLEVMNVPELTRENVASHLQKYRIFLKRVQEASQSLEPNVSKNLTSGALKSSFASGHSLLMFNLQQGFSGYPEQQHMRTAFQPGLRGNFQDLNSRIPMPSFSPSSYLNREASSTNSISHRRYGESLLMSNQGNLQQPLLGTASFLNQEHDPNHIGFGREPHNAPMDSSLYSSLYGDISSGLARITDTSQMIHQTPQTRMGLFANGLLDNNSNTFGLHGNSNVPSIGNLGSFGIPNQLSNFNNTNINCPGIQMNSTAELVGLGQMGSNNIGGEESNNCSYNLMDEICSGKMTEVGNSGYATQGVSSAGGFESTNQFLTMFTSYIQEAVPQPPPPPPPPPLLQQNSLGTAGGGEDDDLFDLIKICSTFENSSLLQPFDESDLGDIIFKQVDESPNQKQGVEENVDPEFSISAYQVDDNPLVI